MGQVNRAMRRFVSKLTGKNKVIFFVVLFLICVLAICIAIYGQFFYKYSDTDPLMLGIRIGTKKTNEEYAAMKASFDTLFTNDLRTNVEEIKISKIDTTQSAVYSYYKIKNEDENYYNVDVKIPAFNINTEAAKDLNGQITERFYNRANTIMRQASGFTNYTVDYAAFVNNGVVSIVIREKIKEEGKAETVRIATYNYSIPEKKAIDLADLIRLKETSESAVQTAIDTAIKTAADNAEALAQEFGTSLKRNPDDKMYKVANADTYFLTDEGYVYIVYDYGEKQNTNEIDIVIF